MIIRPLSAILADLSLIVKTLAEQYVPPIPLNVELDLVDRALRSGSEAQAFRALEFLVFAAYDVGLTKEPALQQAPAYREAVQALQLSDKPLPPDLL